MDEFRFMTEALLQMPESVAGFVRQAGPPAAVAGAYVLGAAAVAGALPKAVRRMARRAAAEGEPADPRKYGGLEVWRLWVAKAQTIEPERVQAALGALALGRRDGVYLELHIGEYTDVVVAGRDIEPALRALEAQYAANVQFVRVNPDEDLFAATVVNATGEGLDEGAGDLIEVSRTYEVGGQEGWGTQALDDFAREADPVDVGASQVRGALDTEAGEAAMIQLHLRPATGATMKDLVSVRDGYMNNPKRGWGSFLWFIVMNRVGEGSRDWVRQQGYGQKGPKDSRDTPNSKRIDERLAAAGHYEARLTAYGRCKPSRKQALVEAFDKFFAHFRAPGRDGGSTISSRKVGGGAPKLDTALRIPTVPPPKREGDIKKHLTNSEVAAMWHPLGADAQTFGRRESLVVSLPPPPGMPKTGVMIGRSNFSGLERPVNIGHAELCRHIRVVGVPGVGKTAELFRLGEAILTTPGSDGKNMGMFCLDPKSDLFTVLLENVGQLGRLEDVIVLDPGDKRFRVPGMNVLAPQVWMTDRQQAQVLVGAFRTRFAAIGWGAKMEEFMTNALYAMVAANRILVEERKEAPRYTVLDLSSSRFLAPKLEASKDDWEPAPMRAEVLRVIGSSRESYRYADLLRYWQSFDENFRASTQKTEVNPVTNKINQLMTDAIIPVFGAPHCDIDFLTIMREGRVFLANLSKNTFGKDGSRLFGSLLLNLSLAASQYRHEQIKRGTFTGGAKEMPYLIDEVQDFTCPEMADIINQGRAYRTPLVVAHQELRQITDPEIDAAFDGVGTSIYFRTDPKDSNRISKVLEDPFSVPVMANMAKHNFVIRGDNLRVTCSTLRLPDEETEEQRAAAEQRAYEVREHSANKYATEWDPDEEERRRAKRYGGQPIAEPPAGNTEGWSESPGGDHASGEAAIADDAGARPFRRRWRDQSVEHDEGLEGGSEGEPDDNFDIESFENRLLSDDDEEDGDSAGDEGPGA